MATDPKKRYAIMVIFDGDPTRVGYLTSASFEMRHGANPPRPDFRPFKCSFEVGITIDRAGYLYGGDLVDSITRWIPQTRAIEMEG